jgi:type I restriction enzyme, S subunit
MVSESSSTPKADGAGTGMSAPTLSKAAPKMVAATSDCGIPENWDRVTIATLIERGATIRTGPFGTLLKAAEYSVDGVPVISVGEIGTGSVNITDDTPRVPAKVTKRLPEYLLRAGDIVFGRKGAVDRSALVRADQDGWFLGSDGIRLRLPRTVVPEYAMYQLQRREARDWLASNSVGTTMASLNQEVIGRVPILIAPEIEQRAIAAALSDADALIGSLDKLIAKKRAIKLATMQQLLNGKHRLQGFAGTWGTVSLGTISEFITKGATPTTYGFGWATDGVTFLRSECVSDHGLDLSESMMISARAHALLKRSEVRSGDILMTITGNVGRVVLLDDRFERGNINQHIARIRISDSTIYSEFVFQYLSQECMRNYYQSITTGQAYPQISLVQVRNTEIPRPSPDEQNAIATVLSDMDDEIRTLELRRDKAKAIKQATVQQLLTGRIRLV